MSTGSLRSAAVRGAAWVLVMAALAGLYVGRNVLVAGAMIGPGPSDFAHSHAAARALAAGASPYSVRGFLYPAPALLPVLPLAALDSSAARSAWFWLSHALLLLAAAALWRALGGGPGAAAAVLAAWALTGTVAENLVLGQVNPVLLLLVTLAMAAPAAAAPRAAMLVGAAAAIKIWPGLLLAEALLRRRWRAFAAGCAVAVLLVAGCTLALLISRPPPYRPAGTGSWAGTPAFLNLSLPATALRIVDPPHDWREMPRSWLEGNRLEDVELPPAAAAVSLLTAVAVLGAGGLVIVRMVGPGTARLPVMAALIALALAAAPVSWYHYRLLHLPGLAWLAHRLGGRRDIRGMVLLAALVAVVSWSHLAWAAPHGLGAAPWFILLRGALVPALELVMAAWYLREAAEPV